jgi:hypothetical protein
MIVVIKIERPSRSPFGRLLSKFVRIFVVQCLILPASLHLEGERFTWKNQPRTLRIISQPNDIRTV